MEAKSIATIPSNYFSPSYRGIEKLSTSDVSVPIAVGFVAISAIAAAIYAFRPKRGQPHLFSFKLPPQAPCHHCRYFSHNPFLQCTIHPSTVLTKHAIDCVDYCPINKW
ncbi:MAG: hypothetical protein KME17_28975 [Cyanosarcina radialis HA8281-LM2]|jgi:hypothetical protein|nr:hypothetical protein [Cyanosarcina radialis HA8281-LM2]